MTHPGTRRVVDQDDISDRPIAKISLTSPNIKSLSDNDKPIETANKNAPKDYGPKVKVAACLGLVAVQVFAATVIKVAQKDGRYAFSPQSSLVMSETIKTMLSTAYLFVEAANSKNSNTGVISSTIDDSTVGSGSVQTVRAMISEQSSQPLVIHMFGLAGLYCINNAIMFWLFARADPGSISLIKSGATVVSAVMMYFWRQFRLSAPRWLVIIVQMLGLVVAQYDACKGRSVLSPGVYVMLLISLFNSSVANVWNEHVIKSFEFAGLAVKNMYLYAFGAFLNMIAFIYYRNSVADTPGFLEGYGPAALGVVTSNAFIGIAMNAVYKYADALVKNVATTTGTVILLIISAIFFAGRNDMMVFIGTVVVICGTFLYFLLGMSEAKIADLEKKLATPHEEA